MVKTKTTKVKSIENEEIIIAMKIIKTVTIETIIIIMMRMRIKLGNRIKILKKSCCSWLSL